jgi:hypothetical protein
MRHLVRHRGRGSYLPLRPPDAGIDVALGLLGLGLLPRSADERPGHRLAEAVRSCISPRSSWPGRVSGRSLSPLRASVTWIVFDTPNGEH